MASQVLKAVQGRAAGRAPIRRALVSVFDKSDIVDLSKALSSKGVEIISTGGTAEALREAGVHVCHNDTVLDG
jgi:phosphoribosylaminoimidazolecarboxamide formyltransferase/IMP cyclohydrolase